MVQVIMKRAGNNIIHVSAQMSLLVVKVVLLSTG